MNVFVALHAAPSEQPNAAGYGVVVVNGRWMTRADVASLAQHRDLRHQQPFVGRAVGIVTRDAAFAARGMLEQERAALFGMTTHAALVDVIADLEEPLVGGPVRVMTRGADQFAFTYRHVRRTLQLEHLGTMALRAGFDLRQLLQLSLL